MTDPGRLSHIWNGWRYCVSGRGEKHLPEVTIDRLPFTSHRDVMESDWPKISTYANPGNLSREKRAVLKDFWLTLLLLFRSQDSLYDEWLKLFPSDATNEKETDEFVTILKETPSTTLRDEFYRLMRHDYADLVPMRFLAARSYEKVRALRMLIKALDFRRKNIPQAMRAEAINDPEFISTIKKGKTLVPCYDKQGRTVTCIRIANHARGDCSQDTFEKYTLYAMESAHLMHLPKQDRTVLLVDMTGFSISTLDLGAIKFIIQNFEQFYPEELSEGIIHNAPWLFSGAWAIIKPLLRSYTREKITFTSSLADLAKKIGQAEAEQALKVSLQYIPRPESEAPFVDQTSNLSGASEECQAAFKTWDEGLEELEAITREWARPPATDTPLDDLEALEKRRAELLWKMSSNYWLIDQYVRPRSYYDRVGCLPPSQDSPLNLQRSSDEVKLASVASRSSSARLALSTRSSSASINRTTSRASSKP